MIWEVSFRSLPNYTEGLKDLMICLKSQSQAGLLAPCDLTRQAFPAISKAQEILLTQGQCRPLRGLQGGFRALPGSLGPKGIQSQSLKEPTALDPPSSSLFRVPLHPPKSSDHQGRNRTQLPLAQPSGH